MIKSQNVMIKGTKDGILLRLDDSCSFQDLMRELEAKLSFQRWEEEESHKISVRVHTGNRYLSEDQREELEKLIRSAKHLIIESIESDVMLKSEWERKKRESEISLVNKIVRSGQILETPGDLLLVGDVNPGGVVRAGGNIFILGALSGTAHAGCYGNSEAVICAAKMNPSQLRISEYVSLASDLAGEHGRETACAFLGPDNEIVIEGLHVLKGVRPQLNRFMEGGF